jgi:hypothetical protein
VEQVCHAYNAKCNTGRVDMCHIRQCVLNKRIWYKVSEFETKGNLNIKITLAKMKPATSSFAVLLHISLKTFYVYLRLLTRFKGSLKNCSIHLKLFVQDMAYDILLEG